MAQGQIVQSSHSGIPIIKDIGLGVGECFVMSGHSVDSDLGHKVLAFLDLGHTLLASWDM